MKKIILVVIISFFITGFSFSKQACLIIDGSPNNAGYRVQFVTSIATGCGAPLPLVKKEIYVEGNQTNLDLCDVCNGYIGPLYMKAAGVSNITTIWSPWYTETINKIDCN
jgi:hypothetical protein